MSPLGQICRAWSGREACELPPPTLPEGRRIAGHQKHGRVVVVNTAPNSAEHVHFVFPNPSSIRYRWHSYDPAEMTYLNTNQGECLLPPFITPELIRTCGVLLGPLE